MSETKTAAVARPAASDKPADEYEPWSPNKPIEDVSDDELKASPLFARIKQASTFPGPGGKMLSLPDEAVLPLVREAWGDAFKQMQVSAFSEVILAVFDALDEAGIEHDNEITVRRRDGVGEYKLPRSGGTRFKHDDYAEMIGYGEGDEKLQKLAKHGGFIVKKTGMKKAEKNGTYELVIEPGIKGNSITEKFKATLYQYPDDGRKMPAIVFPPVSGDKNKLRSDDDVREVASMSKMMKSSALNVPQTPAVIFDLGSKLATIRGENPDEESDEAEDENAKDEAKDNAKNAKTTPAPKPASGKGARALLDDES